MPKYETYKELKKAYDSGELDRETDILYLDNDDCHVYKDGECVFQGNGYSDIEALALALDLPAEWV